MKYIIEMPEDWNKGDWNTCPFAWHGCAFVDDGCKKDCPLANAKKATQVEKENYIDSSRFFLFTVPVLFKGG